MSNHPYTWRKRHETVYRQQGTLSGFDRVVFRGSLRRLTHAQGMKMYLIRNGLLCKQYQDHVKKVSQDLKHASLEAWHPGRERVRIDLPGTDAHLPAGEDHHGHPLWAHADDLCLSDRSGNGLGLDLCRMDLRARSPPAGRLGWRASG